jgi:hypothetical protein
MKSSQEISHDSGQLMSDIPVTVSVSVMSVVFTCYTSTAVVHYNGDCVENGRWILMGWSVSDILSQHRQCGQQLVIKFMLLVIGSSLQCFLSSLICFVKLMAGCHEWLRGNLVSLLKLPDLSDCLNFSYFPDKYSM